MIVLGAEQQWSAEVEDDLPAEAATARTGRAYLMKDMARCDGEEFAEAEKSEIPSDVVNARVRDEERGRDRWTKKTAM